MNEVRPHESAPPRSPGWRRQWIAWRNGVIASARFQRWVSAVPGLRGIARRRSVRAFDLVAGFCYSQVLHAAVQVGLLDLLVGDSRDLATLALGTGLPESAALRLVRAAAALDLAEEVAPGWWMLGQQGAAIQANAGIQAMVRHHALLYADLTDPVALLRRDRSEPTALSQFWRYAAAAPGPEADRYSELMAASQAMVAEQALRAYRFGRHAAVLDVGGGHGAFAMALARAWPQLRLGLFDLPPVVAGAARAIDRAGLSDRVALHPGNFLAQPLPRDYSCMTLVRILHDHDDEHCLHLLTAIHTALPAGGRLVIAEPMSGAAGAAAMGDAYFGFYLWAMNSGRPRTSAEYGRLLERAGFSRWRETPTALPVITSLIVSIK